MNVNFKIERDGKIHHCFSLLVTCERFSEISNNVCYFVRALAYESSVPMIISPIYNTLEEAFDFAEKLAKNYPEYNDNRDFDEDLAPEFDIEEQPFIQSI